MVSNNNTPTRAIAKENKTPLYLKKGLPDNQSTILSDETKLNKILSNLINATPPPLCSPFFFNYQFCSFNLFIFFCKIVREFPLLQ